MEIAPYLASEFPGLRVTELNMAGVVAKDVDSELESFKREVQERVRRRTATLDGVKDQPIFRAYPNFFWKVGIDPTKTRPAGEALTRRILSGRDLPRVNTVVDAYNLASVETSIAIAAFDSGRVNEDTLLMRRANQGEEFHGIGMATPDSLRGVEVVIEDRTSKRLIAVYPYRDSDDSKIDQTTARVLFMMCGVPGIDDAALAQASRLTEAYVRRFCGSERHRS